MASSAYEPKRVAESVLYRVILEHFETFRAQAATLRDGEGLPRFVEQEFRDFLRCGCLASGFARFRCVGCGFDRLVPFSCKGRGFCPSCGGRRMAERAAHLVDDVFPDVAVRQWVLTFPHRVRYLLAWDHDLCRAVVGTAVRAVLGFLRRRAQAAGVGGGRSGAVVVVQRFGGGLNLNVHLHALVLDGVFATDEAGAMGFHRTPPMSREDVSGVLETIERRLARLLRRGGVAGDDMEVSDRWAEEAPVLAGIAGASVQGVVALGPRVGGRVRRCGGPPEAWDPPDLGRCHARQHGFDLHAGIVIPSGHRDRLERLCRYALRPPLAQDRLRQADEGEIWLALRHPWADGTTHLRFDPVELLERLAVLTPRPRVNLILYHGLLAPRAAWRAEVVAYRSPDERVATVQGSPPSVGRPGGAQWAELMRRAFGFDVLACPRCGGRLRLIALIQQQDVIRRILRHLGLPSDVPEPHPPRAPPDRAREADRDWADGPVCESCS